MRGHGVNIDWDEGAVQCLRSLWGDGLSSAAIGRQMGRSKNSIVGKAHRLDLPARPDPIIRDGIAKPRIHRAHRVGAVTLPLFDRWCAQCSGILGAEQQRFCSNNCHLAYHTARRPAPKPPIIRAPKPEPQPVVWLGRVTECCFVVSEGRLHRFCCEPTEPGRPYCAAHWTATHVPLRDRRDAAVRECTAFL